MNKAKYINYDGKIFSSDEPLLTIDNRALKYGDGLFETMHASRNQIQFFESHIQRLKKGMEILRMEIHNIFTTNISKLQKQINTLTNKNKQFKGARVRLTVFRQSGGLYAPETNRISYIIESEPLNSNFYTLNEKGLIIGLYKEQLKPMGVLNSIKTTNSLFFVLAGIYKKENNLDDCLILNEKHNVAETVSSNIFIMKNNVLITPALSEACLPGIIRQKIIELAKSMNMKVDDSGSISIKDVEEADEVFISNAVKGIQWVVGFKSRRYYNKTAKLLLEAINNEQSAVNN